MVRTGRSGNRGRRIRLPSGAELEIVRFLGEAESWERLRAARVRDFDPQGGLGLGACLPQDRVGGDGFAVNLSNQEGFAARILFPKLSDLALVHGHYRNVDRFAGSVNTRYLKWFSSETPA